MGDQLPTRKQYQSHEKDSLAQWLSDYAGGADLQLNPFEDR
jgi:hypothetical protein